MIDYIRILYLIISLRDMQNISLDAPSTGEMNLYLVTHQSFIKIIKEANKF